MIPHCYLSRERLHESKIYASKNEFTLILCVLGSAYIC